MPPFQIYQVNSARWARWQCPIPPDPRQDPRWRPGPERISPKTSVCRVRREPAAHRQRSTRPQWIKHRQRRAPGKPRTWGWLVLLKRAPVTLREWLPNRRDERTRRQTAQPYLQSAAATTPRRPRSTVTLRRTVVRP